MRGQVQSFDAGKDLGVILGDNGQRYSFRTLNMAGDARRITTGAQVEFQVYGVTASDIRPLAGTRLTGQRKSKVIAGLLAIFIGGLGLHKFYLGYTRAGVIMLVVYILGFALFAIPTMIVGVIALIEGIIYLSRPADQFHETYEVGQKQWF